MTESDPDPSNSDDQEETSARGDILSVSTKSKTKSKSHSKSKKSKHRSKASSSKRSSSKHSKNKPKSIISKRARNKILKEREQEKRIRRWTLYSADSDAISTGSEDSDSEGREIDEALTDENSDVPIDHQDEYQTSNVPTKTKSSSHKSKSRKKHSHHHRKRQRLKRLFKDWLRHQRKMNTKQSYIKWKDSEIKSLRLIAPYFRYSHWAPIRRTLRHYRVIHPRRDKTSIKDKYRWLIKNHKLKQEDFGLTEKLLEASNNNDQSEREKSTQLNNFDPLVPRKVFQGLSKYPPELYDYPLAKLNRILNLLDDPHNFDSESSSQEEDDIDNSDSSD